jgi:hypothetical protein
LRIGELDEAVKTLNLRSAPGVDGVSNRFIVKFWKYFREPLFRYATTCINNGKLTNTFRTAIIRLIPKKRRHNAVKKLEADFLVILLLQDNIESFKCETRNRNRQSYVHGSKSIQPGSAHARSDN